MSLTSDVPRRVRQALSQAVDPLIAKRAAKLAHYRGQNKRPAGNRRDAEVDKLRQSVVDDLYESMRKGSAGNLDVLDELVVARLQSLQGGKPSDALTAAVCDAFVNLWTPDKVPVPPPAPVITKAISDQFHKLYYHAAKRTWLNTRYAGIKTYKCPTDMWIYTEIIDDLKPSLIIETGTLFGGSALYMASVLDRIGHGKIVTVDIDTRPGRPEHDRITYVTGSSTAPEIVEQVRGMLPTDGGHVLVILDSDHSRDHVVGELAAYAPMVTAGSYCIVEDSNVNGHPAWPGWGPGPFEATEHFFTTEISKDFEIDESCERYFLTQNPNGFLKRKAVTG